MTAENKHEHENKHENKHEHEPYGDDGRDGMDPLMAALLGEPLSEEARSDPAFMAGHRAATADVDLLREQLGVLADVLTRPAEAAEPAAEPVRRPVVVPLRRPARRLLPLALKTVGVAAAGALVVGSGWLLVQVGRGANDIGASSGADKAAAQDEKSGTSGGTADSPLADPGYLACARLVVEGDVTDVVPVRGTSRERVTLHVTRSYKPQASAEASARDEVEFVMERDMDPLLAEGDHVLVGFARGSEAPDVWAVGEADIAAERSALARALPEADGLPCE
ncbi:hypothetical protein [Streptomyces sp. ID05-47C]|uniref:hypothetical protein n=1 Tax=Streptomyces sp. ID05-47C TaxID=3028665 RepID=UPI0029A75180|nr:hypothetical protein [Streptomyces sp. ID05-47C]MDX3572649.1 hypothetical protein [Streptomyces sp. ID05-47C]